MDQQEQSSLYRCIKCNWEFESIEDYESHSSQDYCTTITDLDANCLDKIFKHLSPNDLASVSLTCKHYKKQAERYFVINQNPNIQLIEVGASFDHIKFQFRQESSYAYEKIFHSLIHSVLVTFNGTAPKQNVFEFIRNNCTETIRHLMLQVNRDKYCVPLNGSINWETSLIADQLKTLTDLELIDVPGHDLYEILLVHCNNLRTLIICCPGDPNDQSNQYEHQWLNQTYTNLETLKLIGNFDDVKHELDLTNFLQCNRNIKNIYCDGGNVQAIHSICRSENKLKNVIMFFEIKLNPFHNRNIDWNEILKWGHQGNCENLEFVFDGICFETVDLADIGESCGFKAAIQTVLNFENIMALHLHEHIRHFFADAPNIIASNIRKLCVSFDGSEATETMFGNLARTFPNLCELNQYINLDLSENCFLPIDQFPKLECFTCFADSFCLINLPNVDFNKFNKRAHWTNAPRLNVYLNKELFQKVNPITEERKIIILKPVDCFECCYCF